MEPIVYDARLVAIREASTPSLIPGSTARYVSMRDVERIFAAHVTSPAVYVPKNEISDRFEQR